MRNIILIEAEEPKRKNLTSTQKNLKSTEKAGLL
jgi:hypothetical protein